MHVAYHFVLDGLIVGLTFVNVTGLRFSPDDFLTQLFLYWPGIVAGAMVFASTAYIFGLYSLHHAHESLFRRSLILAFCLLVSVGVMMGIFYINFSARIGRGVMLASGLIAYGLVLLHHFVIWHRLKNHRERVAFVIASADDEIEYRHLMEMNHPSIEVKGVVCDGDYRPQGGVTVLGSVEDLPEIARRENLGRIFGTSKAINSPRLYREFCQLRYAGVTVMPLVGLFEEIHQFVPTELITPEWMMAASSSPQMLYLRKVKRAFDVAVALFFLVLFAPVLLLAMAWVRLVSKGSVLFRQIRCGRFGKPFQVLKLRTMNLDAEKDGAVWAREKDPRVLPGGAFMRKYRIDEIPQLINVLAGEMSFVGPRPERPEFVESLAAEIPYYRERLMVQPGITGWAQVNYPYGACIEDARRKLEYDLYYMKRMSVFLDLFVLLDTVRIILCGGARKRRHVEPLSDLRAPVKAEADVPQGGAAPTAAPLK